MNTYYENLKTETVNPRTAAIDECGTLDILKLINEEDQQVALAVRKELDHIAQAVDMIYASLKNGGHMYYLGAGTSGRLGVLDASECVPTYGTPPEMVQGYIAGGDGALRTAVEGCEDNEEMGRQMVADCGTGRGDIVVGISASGSAAFVIGALKEAARIGAGTIGIVNNKNSWIAECSAVCIEAVTGPEVIIGSTRMKAGTAQKMILNMLSTAVMIKLGKVYGNMMVDLKASNRKLDDRAKRIFCEVTGESEEEAKRYLMLAGKDTKLAILMCMSGYEKEEAEELLREKDGYLKKALQEVKSEAGRKAAGCG